MDSLKKCPYCGRSYKLKEYSVKGNVKKIYVPDCECADKKLKNIKNDTGRAMQAGAADGLFQLNTLPPLYAKFNFDNVEDSFVARSCREYALSFQKGQKEGIACIGKTGSGKSVLLACICQEVYKRGFSYLFINTALLLDKFVQSMDFSSKFKAEDLLKALREIDFIVLDDFGRDCLSVKRREFMLRIAEEADVYEKCISITASPSSIALMKECPGTDAIFDRIAALCPYIYIFKGKSFRRHGKENYIANIRDYETS